MTKIQKDAITQRKNIMATKERIKRKYFEKHKEREKMKKIRNTFVSDQEQQIKSLKF